MSEPIQPPVDEATPRVPLFNIVAIDNFNRDLNGGRSEWVIAGSIRSEEQAMVMADAWNARFCTDHGLDYAVVRPAEQPLYVFKGY